MNSAQGSEGVQKVDLKDLRNKSVRGGAITLVAQLISVVVQLASTIVLARILTPREYGIIGMVAVLISFAGLFKDLGLSAASIQKGNLTHEQMSNLFWINVFLGTTLTFLVAALSPVVVLFYGREELLLLTVLLSFNFIITSLGTQHGALMQRELQFEKRAYALIGSSITTLFVSIVLALKGLSYWALAWGSLAGSISSVIILFVCSSFRPGRWTGVENVKSLLRFGANVTAFDFINYFHRNTDSILIGKFWGSEVLGLYGRAYQILMFPLSRLRGPISSVAFPVLSKLVNEPENYCRYYRKIIYLLAVTSMPLMAFLFVSSEEFIETAFGANWLEAAPIFSFLAVTGFIQPVASLRGMVFLSTGQSKRYLYWGIINALFVTAAFMLGVVWGAVGVAVSYAAINYLLLLPSLSYAFRKSPLTLLDFFKPIAMPAFSSLCAIACCMASREFFGWFSSTEAWLRLLGMAVFYALIYMSILLIFPTSRRDVVRTSAIFREIKRGKKEA